MTASHLSPDLVEAIADALERPGARHADRQYDDPEIHALAARVAERPWRMVVYQATLSADARDLLQRLIATTPGSSR